MGFLPFVNQGGRRIVRWHRLVLVWIAVVFACILGYGAMSYALMGDFWHDSFLAIWLGVFLAACVTVRGFFSLSSSCRPFGPGLRHPKRDELG